MRLFFSRKHQERKSGDDMPLPPIGSSLEGDGVEPNTENNTWAEDVLGGVDAGKVASYQQGQQEGAGDVAPALQQGQAMQQGQTVQHSQTQFTTEVEPQTSHGAAVAASANASVATTPAPATTTATAPYIRAANRGMDPELLKQLEMVTAGIFATSPSEDQTVDAADAHAADADMAAAEDVDDVDAGDDSAAAKSRAFVAEADNGYVDDDDSFADEDAYEDEEDVYEDDGDDFADDEDDIDARDADEDAAGITASAAHDFTALGGAAATQSAVSFTANTAFNSSTNDDLRVTANADANADADAAAAAAVASILVRERLEAQGSQETDGIGSPDGSPNECEFKLEEVDSTAVTDPDPLTLTPFLEEDDLERQERLEELQAERVAAQKQEFFKLTDDSAQFFDARLQNMQMIRVHTPTLLDEDTEQGEVETEDFITGNVTILATGTDSAGGVTSGGARRVDGDDAGDGDDLEQRNKEVIDIIELIPGKEDYRSSVSLGYDASLRPREPKLVPLLLQDILRNCLVYIFAGVACLLCLAKIYQVQETRELTSCLNEVSLKNTDLENEKLSLLATSQSLSEYIKVSTFAREQLHMQAPKIENEQVIFLHR